MINPLFGWRENGLFRLLLVLHIAKGSMVATFSFGMLSPTGKIQIVPLRYLIEYKW